MSTRQPALFVGHGSPLNAIEDNAWSRAFRALGATLSRPKAVLAVSAHWYVSGTFLTGNAQPDTIHDFGGFPRALHEMRYPAPGAPELARRVVRLLGSAAAGLSTFWGLDHGTWTVLHHLFPAADVPVVQLSLDRQLAPAQHLEVGRALALLRGEGVLVFASGNVTHNLQEAMQAYATADFTTPAWARAFDAAVEQAVLGHDVDALVRLPSTDAGRRAHPSVDHYLPLLYAAGASDRDDPVTFPVTGFDAGSLSMRAIRFG